MQWFLVQDVENVPAFGSKHVGKMVSKEFNGSPFLGKVSFLAQNASIQLGSVCNANFSRMWWVFL
eukprot:2427024-Rhodomonas_salina.2